MRCCSSHDPTPRSLEHVNKKDAVTSDMIKALFVKYSATRDLAVVRDLAMIIMCFCGFLRYDEVSNIKCKDITFVHISKSN